jgi:hypothetical protein
MFQRFMRSPLSTTERKHLCPKRQILYSLVRELSAFANRNHYPPRVLSINSTVSNYMLVLLNLRGVPPRPLPVIDSHNFVWNTWNDTPGAKPLTPNKQTLSYIWSQPTYIAALLTKSLQKTSKTHTIWYNDIFVLGNWKRFVPTVVIIW